MAKRVLIRGLATAHLRIPRGCMRPHRIDSDLAWVDVRRLRRQMRRLREVGDVANINRE